MPKEPILGMLVSHCRHRKNLRTLNERLRNSSGNRSFSLYYFTRGACRIETNGRCFTIGRGEAYIGEPGLSFSLQGIPGRTPSFFVMTFTPVSLSGSPDKLQYLGLPTLCRVRKPREMGRFFCALSALFADRERIRGRFRAEECSALGLRILLLLEPSVQPLPSDSPDERSAARRIWDVLDYINIHYKERLSVVTLAKKAVLYPVYFSRVFKRVTGLSPHQYVLEKKIEKAKDFLLLHNVTPASTAVELGFHDYSHFYRVFRKMTGKSPTAFAARGSTPATRNAT